MSKVENRYYPESEVVYPYGAEIINIEDITISDRGRKDLGDIQSLAESIANQGLISPILLNQENELVAGERRLRAHELLGLKQVAVVFRETLTPSQLTELELEENQMRKAMQWHEEVRLIVKAHKLKCYEDSQDVLSPRELSIIESTGAKVWGQEQTGRLLSVAAGQVSMAHYVFEYIQSGDEEILGASSISAAYKILLKRREDQATKQRAQQVKEKLPTQKPVASQSGGLGGEVFSFTDTPTLTSSLDEDDTDPDSVTEIPLSQMFVHGSCLDHMETLEDATFHHIFTDPPYGIDMANLDTIDNIDTVKDTHRVHDNLDLLKEFIFKSRRIIKPSGFMLMWADASHFEKILNWGKDAGWTMQRWPLIWHKLHPCKNNAAAYNTTKDYEICVKFRAGSEALMAQQGGPSVFSCDGHADAKLYNNPFSKPFELWQWLFKRFAVSGQLVYDPFGGEFSMARAAINCGLNPVSVELDQVHYDKGLVDMTTFYTKLLNGKVKFV